MSIYLKNIFCYLVILFLCESALSQDKKTQTFTATNPQSLGKKAKTDISKKKLTPQQQQALELIGYLSDKAKSLDNQQSKIRIRTQMADLLWKYDEPQARTLFGTVFQEANAAFSDSQKETQKKRVTPLTFSSELQMLTTVLSAIVRHDKNWAEQLRKTVADTKILMNQSSQSFLSSQMAISLLETDPESAAQITLASLDSGFSPMIAKVLHELQHKNPALAEQLFIKALSVVRRDSANAIINIHLLSLYVFPSLNSESLEAVLGRNQGTSPVSATLIRQFLDFVYDAITNKQEGEEVDPDYARLKPSIDFQTAYQLLPFFEQYTPEKAVPIRSQLNEMSRVIPPTQLDSITNSNVESRIEALKTKADSAPLAMKDSLYTQAAMLASRNGLTDQALSIALNISKEKREDILSLIHYQATMKAVGKRDMDDAFRHAQEINEPPLISIAFNQLAKELREKKQKEKAIEYLNYAEIMIEKFFASPNKAYALLEITNEMVELDIRRGFDLMGSVIKAFNQSELSIDYRLGARGKMTVGLSSINFDLSFSKLAVQDFDRTLYLAQFLDHKDASLMAQLSACRGILINPGQNNTEKKKSDEKNPDKPQITKKSDKSN